MNYELTYFLGDIEECKTGHVLVITQSSVTNSVTEYLTSKSVADRESFHQKSGWQQQDWTFTVSELTTDNVSVECWLITKDGIIEK